MNHLKRLLITLVLLLTATTLLAGSKRNVDDNDTVPLHGNVHPVAQPQYDRGRVDMNLRYDKMIMVLPQRKGAKDSIDKLIMQLHDPKSPLYHQWLTPDQFGKRFGVSDDDLQDVTDWLHRRGFTIDHIAPGRQWINFSGTVGDVERGFKTEIHSYQYNGKTYHGNSKDPEVPRALLDVLGGVVSLHNFPKKPMNLGIKPVNEELIKRRIAPEYTSGTSHYLAPADFATIYNVNALYSAGINGSGQTIAIVGRTDIALADVQYFRSFFGLPANDPVFVHNGTDPGNLGTGEEGEADLDVEWSGAVAPNATIKFVISQSTSTTDGVDLSAQYIVTNNLAPVMSLSFGQCESAMGAAENTFYNNLWSQAATQGISAFVSSGDAGAAGCNGGSDTTGSGAAISGLASTPYNIAVGGTQFSDAANPSTYWNATNAANQSSAKSYIPEVAWNESANVSGGSGLWASSGGVSTIYAKPSWQVCVGVPNDGKRDIPDVALTAAGHDGYLVVQGHTSTVSGLGAVGGTSASSPSFAGLMALVVQKTGARQGNANTKFYSLANAQYTGSGPTIFHDTTSGNNSVPGVTGFSCGTGYDAVTGVGSVDANALVNNWGGSATPDFAISASPTTVSALQGATANSTITTTVSGGFSNAVALTSSGAPTGATVSFSPASIAAPGSGSSTMTITVGAATAPGTYSITVTGTGGSTTHSATVTLTVTTSGGSSLANGGFETGTLSSWTATGSAAVNAAAKHTGSFGAQLGSSSPTTDSTVVQTFTMPATSPTLSFWYANTCPDTVTYDWATATIKDNVSGTTTTLLAKACTTTPVWTQVSWNGAASAGHSVTLTLANHDDNFAGDPTFTYYDDVTVTSGGGTPAFTIAASPTSVSAVQGTNASSTISTTVSGGFNSAIALSATGAPAGTTVSFSPASIAAPGSGSSTMTMTVGASTAVGTYTITVTGTGGSLTHTATVTLTVTAAATPAFTLSASPTSVSAVQGTNATSTISTTVSGGFNSSIALSATGAPAGTTVSFSPASIAAPGSGSSTMTISVGASTAVGTYTITVTGSGGSITHTATVTLTVTASGGTPQQLMGNPGFENGSASPAPWTTTAGVIDNSTGEAAHSGTWKAWMDGYGSAHTDTVQQTVTIPSTVTTATLSFYLHIDTAETTTTTAFDTLQVQIRNSSGTVLATLATYSNLNAATGFTQKSFNVIAYKGQTIQVFLVGTEDTSAQTSFVVDDFALNVQ